MNGVAAAQLEAVSVRNTYWLELIKWLAGTIVATGACTWAARGILADQDHRLTVVETRQNDDGQTLRDIRDELRDMTQAVISANRSGAGK